ncbi:MAG: bacterial extracellular solute-binding s, 5 Middle family protein [Rubritepida sp.]|nr:bacterial extracellular solute-binding s, 5 Middle family protein [Rubritepida sp.]
MMLPRRSALALPALIGTVALSRPGASQAGGGVLRIAMSANLRNLDPAKMTIGEEFLYSVLVFNGLTRMKEDQSIEPELAESWTYSDDLKTWEFKLRRGVKFHHGREMTADDVIATYRRVLDPATSSPSRSNYDMIEQMEAPDPHTVIFRLSYAYGGFADILSDRQVKIIPADKVDDLATRPIGTGPFTLRSYTPGDRMVLARNPDYWEAGPKFDGVELRILPEMSVRIAALQAGDLDVVWDLGPENVRALRDVRNVRTDSVATASWDGAIMNCSIPPFNDVRVRRALHLAVPKADVAEAVLFGEGTPTHSPIAPNHPFFASDIPIPTRADVAGARRLLREAGHSGPIRVPLIIPVGRPVRERLGVTLQQMARPSGFEFEIQRVPFGRYSAEVAGKVPIYIDGYFARPTIDTSTYPFLHSRGSQNSRLWIYSDPRVDAALDAARLAGDVNVQKEHYVAMQRALVDNPPCYFAYAQKFACAYRTAVKDVQTHPMRWFDLRAGYIAS